MTVGRRGSGAGNQTGRGGLLPPLLSTPPASPRSAAQFFRTAEVARILRTTPSRVRAIVRAGLCQPAPGTPLAWFERGLACEQKG
jgi:hypothetical protein